MARAKMDLTVHIADLPEVRELVAALAAAREELRDLRGPCSDWRCRLHFAHSGPCVCVREETH